jgi:hypothetical protein
MSLGRVVIMGGLAFAAVVVPVSMGGSEDVRAQCNAYFGSRNDGICLDGPEPQVSFGIPPVTVGPTDGGGPGLSTGPLLPGETINIPVA